MVAILKISFRFFSWTERPIELKLGRKHQNSLNRSDRKSKMAVAAILKIFFFASSHEPKGQLTWNLVGSIEVTCRSKLAKSVPIRNPGWPPCRHLEHLFFASPEPKGQLTWNLVRSIGVFCRSKLAKIVSIWNPSWPSWRQSWKSIFRFFFWIETPIDLKFGRKHQGDL